jgi:hypothetical protein
LAFREIALDPFTAFGDERVLRPINSTRARLEFHDTPRAGAAPRGATETRSRPARTGISLWRAGLFSASIRGAALVTHPSR